jgi:recombination protein RecA
MAKNKTIVDESQMQDDLASVLADNLNKKFKGSNYKVAYFLEGDSDAPSDVTEWISTGSTMLDLAISNRPNGGLPVGRIIEITGLEASGKSLVAAHALADTQKKGGLAVYIDTENAVSREYLEAIGINLKDMLYIPLETIEDIFDAMDSIVESVRKNSKSRIVTIVVDSVAGASTKQEMAADYDKDGWATSKAIILSKAMRKITNFVGRERICLIFTNQLRTRLGVTFGDQWTTSGGKAIAFHSSVRLRLKSVGQIKLAKSVDAPEAVVGITTRAQVVKNRMGPPLRMVDYDIYFDSGIDDFGSWLTMMKNFGLVTQAGAWYTYTNTDTGEIIKFQSKDFKSKLMTDPEMKAQVYKTICEKYILNYKAGEDFGIDDIQVQTDFEGEES